MEQSNNRDLHWILKNHPHLVHKGKTISLEERIKIDAFVAGYLFGKGELTEKEVIKILSD